MDFKDHIKLLGERVLKLRDQILTEEATKNAFIMPFLQCLGYDVFNPLEVVPEFISDIGIKKGEKVDYAIFKENAPVILIECKHWSKKLDPHDGQLLRYFHVSKAKFAILTNGVRYKFYTDLAETNKMDEKPFLEFDITDIKDSHIEELKKFHKSYFDVQTILTTASDLKYTNEIKSILTSELKSPSEQFIKYFTTQVYTGRITEKIIFQFSELVRKSTTQVISEMITERLKSALDKEAEASEHIVENLQIQVTEDSSGKENKIETTSDEMEAYYIVKSILRQSIEINRISYRDAQSYFSILLDDSNRKCVCRFYFNTSKKYVGIFDEAKKETKYEIATLNDIFNYSTQMISTVEIYERIKGS